MTTTIVIIVRRYIIYEVVFTNQLKQTKYSVKFLFLFCNFLIFNFKLTEKLQE